ncbi:MAG: peptidoglycan DD-metalloendopeptidase family protein [bacterium]|nr:peptidoglycan DD-metalloendopeptidase family protein [bacterium]
MTGIKRIALGALACAVPLFAWAQALPPEQLNVAIQEKSRMLQDIQRQLEETQKNLSATQQEKRTLANELSVIQKNIKQLDLGMKSNTVKISKLKLEITGLAQAIKETDRQISVKTAATESILKEVQLLDDTDPLIVFLKHATLTQAVNEQSRLTEINGDLAQATAELQALNDDRQGKLTTTAQKKTAVEGEYKNLTARKSIVEDKKKEQQEILTVTKNKEKTYQELAADLAKRQAEIAAEIEAIDAALRLKIDQSGLPSVRKGVLGWPTPETMRITQKYGATAFALRGGYKGKWHNGIDIGGASGAVIASAEEGVVVAAGNQDLYCKRGAYGKFVVVRHPNNLVTLYGHMSKLNVTAGQRVTRGETIGYMGNTGYAFGVHLHFTVYDGTTFTMGGSRVCGPMPTGGDLDPQPYL